MITGTLRAYEASLAAPSADAAIVTVDTVSITADALNAGDVASFTGTVAMPVVIVGGGVYRPQWRPVTGVLVASEQPDSASFSGIVGSDVEDEFEFEVILLLLAA
jgi:hypothetical protein